METLRKITPTGSLGCFYCGVDSTSTIIFLVGLIGCLVLSTVFFGISMWLRGRFKDSEEIKYEVFEAERRV